MKTAIFQIFKAGCHKAGNRPSIENWGIERLQQIAKCYNPDISPAPLVIDHPPTDKPEYGQVKHVFIHDDGLFAEATISETLIDKVKAGECNGISCRIHLPHGSMNPFPDYYYLRHVGFLMGKLKPAVKGMLHPITSLESLAFSEINEDFILFNEFNDFIVFNETQSTQEESEQIHAKTKYIQSICNNMDYRTALNITLRGKL